ncbi:MAG: DHH family phosphoesterase [Candidatus Helarchaeota archaeon]
MKKIIIITHREDLDGIGSAAILKRYYDQSGEYFFFFYYSLYSEFMKLISKAIVKDFDLLYITDIGFNESYLPFFRGTVDFHKKNNYESIRLKFKKIYWIDHHLINNENRRFMESILGGFIHNAKNDCASKLLYKYLKEKYGWIDSISEQISNFANAVDHNISLEISDMLQRVINANQTNLRNLYKIMLYLSEGDFENDWIINQNKERLKVENIEIKRVLKNLINFEINGLKILIGISEIFTTGSLIKYLFNNLDADIYLTINGDQVSIRSHSINVRNIATEFGGGGHKFRAGFVYKDIIKDNKISKKFIEEFKNIISIKTKK